MGIKSTNKCEHCETVDFIEHMFIHCQLIKGYWNHVFKLIFDYTGVQFQNTESNIVLGLLHVQNTTKNYAITNIANHIL